MEATERLRKSLENLKKYSDEAIADREKITLSPAALQAHLVAGAELPGEKAAKIRAEIVPVVEDLIELIDEIPARVREFFERREERREQARLEEAARQGAVITRDDSDDLAGNESGQIKHRPATVR